MLFVIAEGKQLRRAKNEEGSVGDEKE